MYYKYHVEYFLDVCMFDLRAVQRRTERLEAHLPRAQQPFISVNLLPSFGACDIECHFRHPFCTHMEY